MLERSVACSDLSSLHSYFSTGIVRLMSPLHNRCHLSVRLRAVQNLRGFSGYDCKTEQGTDVGNSFFRQAFDTLSKSRQGGWGEQTGLASRIVVTIRLAAPKPDTGGRLLSQMQRFSLTPRFSEVAEPTTKHSLSHRMGEGWGRGFPVCHLSFAIT